MQVILIFPKLQKEMVKIELLQTEEVTIHQSKDPSIF